MDHALSMEHDKSGQKSSGLNPSASLSVLVSKRAKMQEELRNIEKQVYELETSYLQESNQFGSVLKGFEGFFSSTKSTSNMKRVRKFQPEDRLFSLSSVTSPAVEELGRDGDGRGDYGPVRSKGGGSYANGQGKPKRGGRSAARDGKKLRPSNDTDLDDDDDY